MRLGARNDGYRRKHLTPSDRVLPSENANFCACLYDDERYLFLGKTSTKSRNQPRNKPESFVIQVIRKWQLSNTSRVPSPPVILQNRANV